MSVAMVLMGWVAASLVLTPLLGRLMSFQDDAEGRSGSRELPAPSPAQLRYGAHASVRRNVAISLPRRDMGWRRIG